MDLEKHLQRAEGYLELDMFDDALAELKNLTTEELQTSRVREIHAQIYMKKKDWMRAWEFWNLLTLQEKNNASCYLNAAYCLHELKRTAEARETLLDGPPSLRKMALFHYNMACYEAQLGHLQAAWEFLQKAFEMDEKFRRVALGDADLAPLRARFMPREDPP